MKFGAEWMTKSGKILSACKNCEYLGSDSTSIDSWWYECTHPLLGEDRALPLDIQRNIEFDESYMPPPDWCPLREKKGIDLEAARNLSQKM